MNFAFFLLASLATLTFALPASTVPDPSQVYIESISYGGSGCPQGSVEQLLSDDLSTITLSYDTFVAAMGLGIKEEEATKTCQLSINLNTSQGFTYTIASVQYSGHMELPEEFVAIQYSTYYFSTQSQQAVSTTEFKGPDMKDYLVTNEIPQSSQVWNDCMNLQPLLIRTSIHVLGPQNSSRALMTIGSQDAKVVHILGLQWKQC